MRLQKFLALAGVASRRKAEEYITAGRVSVNGKVIRELGSTVDENARVTVDNKPVRIAQTFSYFAVNKPAGVMTTMRDPEGRRTIVDYLPRDAPRVVPVGRLDYDTSGLLLLTNDGDLAFKLSHPRFGVEKTYRALVRGELTQKAMEALQRGVRLKEFRTSAARLHVIATRKGTTLIELTIHEGKYRQVRRMFEALGHPVDSLVRTRFGPLELGSLRAGHVRPLTAKEVAALRRSVENRSHPWKASSSSAKRAPRPSA